VVALHRPDHQPTVRGGRPGGLLDPFFLAPLVRGTGVDDPPHPIPRVAGVPTSLLGAAATTLTAVAGWLLDRRSR
jgi:hypothetical protein